MFRNTLLAAALAVFSAVAAHAAVDKIAQVEVTGKFEAIANERAAAYWTNLKPDLEAAIVSRLEGKRADDGLKLTVNIQTLELSNAFERTYQRGDSVLVGQVTMTNPKDGTNAGSYELSVSLEAITATAADGSAVNFATIDAPGAYERMIEAFADYVVEKLN